MKDLIVSKFEDKQVRTNVDEAGELWFIAKDVIDVLGLKNTSMALRKLQKEEKGVTSADTLGGKQDLMTVNESGLYALIFQSRRKEAAKFRFWVTNEVLPSLRKTGSYQVKEIDPLDQLKMHVAIMEKQRFEIRQLNAKLSQVEQEAKQENDTLTHDQISELDKHMNNKYKELGTKDYRVLGLMKKQIKQEFFEITGSRTWKEIPRHGFHRAMEMITNFQIPAYLKL